MALCGATPRKFVSRYRRDLVACTRTLLVRVLMGTETFPTSLATNVEGQSSFVHSLVRVPFNQRRSFVREVRSPAKFVRPRSSFAHEVRSYSSGRIARPPCSRIGAARRWPAWTGSTLEPTDSDMFDLQHEDAQWEGSLERKDAGEDGAASVTCRRRGLRRRRQTQSTAAGGQQQDEEEGCCAKDGWRSLAGSEPSAGAGRAFASGGWSRRPAATLAARLLRASGQPVSGGRVAAPAAANAPAPPAAEDNILQDTVDTIAERELDRDDELQQDRRRRQHVVPRMSSAVEQGPVALQLEPKQQWTRTRRHNSESWPAIPFLGRVLAGRQTTLSRFRCKLSRSSSAVHALQYCAWVTFCSSRSVRGKYKSCSTQAQVVLIRGKDMSDDFCHDTFFSRFSIIRAR